MNTSERDSVSDSILTECKPERRKRICMQIMIFVLTYITYSSLHFAREAWSIIKPDVEDNQEPGLEWEGRNKAGLVDFFFLFSYNFGLFISGFLGDNFSIRIILPIGYLIVSGVIIISSFGGTWRITSVYFYIVFFSISGFFQSIGWPSLVSVLGNWFSKESIGLVFGVWTTCQNLGNIGGNLLANFFRETLAMT